MVHSQKNNSYNFVYCLAGKGSRFTNVGINLPKYLLKLGNDKSIIENSIMSFNFPEKVKLVLIINNDHIEYKNELEMILSKYSENYNVISVNDTNGQAETANIAIDSVELLDNWVFFFNGDTLLKNRNLNSLISKDLLDNTIEGYIDVFRESSINYSFVETDSQNIVIDIKEKIVISNKATSGLYGFKSKLIYQNFYLLLNNLNDENFISDVYKLMLDYNRLILASDLFSVEDSVILGTPEDYNKNKNKF